LILDLRSLSSVKVTGQSSRSPQENVAKVISAAWMTYVVSATVNDFILDYCTVLLPYTYIQCWRKCVESAILRGWLTSRLNFGLKGYVSRLSLCTVR